jgi:hypothetical protein
MDNQKLYNLSGIFAIHFKDVGMYLGITSEPVGKVFLSILKKLRAGRFSNKKLQEAFKECGEKCMKFYILDTGYRTKKDILHAAKKWKQTLEEKNETIINQVKAGRINFRGTGEVFSYEGELPIFAGKNETIREKLQAMGIS